MPYCPGCGYPHQHESLGSGIYRCGWCQRKFKTGELLPKEIEVKQEKRAERFYRSVCDDRQKKLP